MSPRAPWRSIQRPTGMPARAETPSPSENAPVMKTRGALSRLAPGRSRPEGAYFFFAGAAAPVPFSLRTFAISSSTTSNMREAPPASSAEV